MIGFPPIFRGLLGPLIVVFLLDCAVCAGQDAAPSSHFGFDDHFEGDILINEVRVPKDGEAMYTYYETLGWSGKAGGYAGIQAHPEGHNYIFSIWDHKSHQAPIKAVYHGPGTKTEDFGGEGTGLKAWNFELDWDKGVWYSLISRCWPVGDHTCYAFWARSGKTEEWTHLITMDVAAENAFFQGGTGAFIEDWLETGENPRTIHLRKGWKRKLDGQWHAFGSGRYSVNSWDLEKGKRSYNHRTHWNGGVDKDTTGTFYFMTSGGRRTKPTSENPSKHSIGRKEKTPDYKSIQIKSVKGKAGNDRTVKVSWKLAPLTLPQFSYTIAVYDNASGSGEPLDQITVIDPQARTGELTVPKAKPNTRLFVRLACRDILDNQEEIRINL